MYMALLENSESGTGPPLFESHADALGHVVFRQMMAGKICTTF